MAPTEKQAVKIPAQIYPGMFDGEFQVTLDLPGHGKINLNVPSLYVEPSATPTSVGVAGYLRVDIVGATGDSFVIALPGDVEGAPSRVTAERGSLHQVA